LRYLLADIDRYRTNGRAMLQCWSLVFGCRRLSVTLCIVAKRCVL